MPRFEHAVALKVRRAAVAGQFYAADATRLREEVGLYLQSRNETPAVLPKALIVPHAGYIYSGPVAASAYVRLRPARDRITRVVLLGPAHTMAFRGLAVTGADAFATPLGSVPVDTEAVRVLQTLPQVKVLDDAHLREHAIEVQLPFLQLVLGEFKIVPLIVGNASDADVRDVLEKVWGGPETLIIISSDLSHYQDYDTAWTLDQATARAIEGLQPEEIHDDQACGVIPLRGFLLAARQRRLRATTVDLRNSGDTAGPRDRVVGYGAWIFEEIY